MNKSAVAGRSPCRSATALMAALILMLPLPIVAQDTGNVGNVLDAERVRGVGDWTAKGLDTIGVQRWEADLVRQNDDLEGQVRIVGSPLLTSGTLRGEIDGQAVSGTITDSSGRHAVRFSGKLQASGGLKGRYEDRNGDVGFWAWEGPLP